MIIHHTAIHEPQGICQPGPQFSRELLQFTVRTSHTAVRSQTQGLYQIVSRGTGIIIKGISHLCPDLQPRSHVTLQTERQSLPFIIIANNHPLLINVRSG